jgi:pyrroloquinoline quinone biosynthesis protein B
MLDTMERFAGLGHTRLFFTHLNHSNPAVDPSSAPARRLAARGFAVVREGMEFPL